MEQASEFLEEQSEKTEWFSFNYYYSARCLSSVIFIGLVLLYYLWDHTNPYITPIIVSGSVISGFTVFSTSKKYLVKLHSRPLWLEDLEGYEDKEIAKASVKMFGWLLVITTGIVSGITAFSLPKLLELFRAKTFFEAISMIGGLFSFFKTTNATFGSMALNIIVKLYDKKGTKRTPELTPHKRTSFDINIDDCDLRDDFSNLSQTTGVVLNDTLKSHFPCMGSEDEQPHKVILEK